MSVKNRTFASEPTMGAASAAVVNVAGLKLPVAAVAIGISFLVHGALFSALSVIHFAPAVQTKPSIELTRGDSAIQVIILSTPWPEPEKEIEERPLVDEDSQEYQASPDAVAEAKAEAEMPGSGKVESNPPLNNDEAVPVRPAVLAPPTPEIEEISRSDVPVDREHLTEVANDSDGEETAANPGSNIANSLGKRATARVEIASRRKSKRDHPPTVRKKKSTSRHVKSAQSSAADSGVESGIEVLNLPRPMYPLVSRRRGEEGVVLLQVEVLPSGRSGRITVLSEPGYPRLTKSAIEAASEAQFRPAMRNGKPIRNVVRIPFRFVLR